MNINPIQGITKELLSKDLTRNLSGYSNEFGGLSSNVFNQVTEITKTDSNAKEYLNSFMQYLNHHRTGAISFENENFTADIADGVNTKVSFTQIPYLHTKSDDVYFALKNGGYDIVVSESGFYDLSCYWFIGGLAPANKTLSVYLKLYKNNSIFQELDCKWLYVNIIGVGSGEYYFPIAPLQGSKTDLYLTKDDTISIVVYYTAGIANTDWQSGIVSHYGSINLKYSETQHKRN